MTLTLAFSPCPNDTFIFDAAIHEKIDTEGLKFEVRLGDVEELNIAASKVKTDITKLSYHAYLYVSNNYQLLRAGSALGKNNGPLLIAKQNKDKTSLRKASVAVPGLMTTANLLFSIAYPEAGNKTPILFSEIEQAVQNGEFDYGLIIHENRFTYHEKGLRKIADMGEFWENKTGLPIPLGGIAIRRDFDDDLKQKVNRIIRRSIKYAYDNPASSMDFIKCNAQEMNPEVMRKHIDLYVNEYSFDIKEIGEKAIDKLFTEAAKKGIKDKPFEPYIIPALC